MKALDFFQEMVKAFDDNGADDSEYREMEAAMLVYKIADQALHRGRLDQSVDVARRHIAKLDDLDARKQLMGMLADTDPEQLAFPDRLYADFLIYGIRKHDAGQYGAAIVAFRIVLQTADTDLRLSAMLRLAWSIRARRQFSDAIDAYDALELAAIQAARPRMAFEGQLGRAKIAIDQGEYTQADAMLAEIVRKSLAANERAMMGKAYIDRARVAGIQGDHVRAVQFSHASLPDLDSPASYERALSNIACGLREMHRTESATELARWLARRTRNEAHRAELCVLLYHLAIDSHDWIAADGYRHMLSGIEENHELVADYTLAVCRHDAGTNEWGSAARSAARMYELATQYHLAEQTATALRAVHAIQGRSVPDLYPEGPTVTLAEIETIIYPIEMDLVEIREREREMLSA